MEKDMFQTILNKAKDSKIILIGGCSRSGKSTLTRRISQEIPSTIISLDNFLVGINERKPEMTVRERFKYHEIEEACKSLIQGKTIRIKKYDAQTRKITDEIEEITPKGLIIIEGVVALDNEYLLNIADLSIYVDIGDAEREQRVISFYLQKGLSEREAKEVFHEREKEEVILIKNTKKNAQIVFIR